MIVEFTQIINGSRYPLYINSERVTCFYPLPRTEEGAASGIIIDGIQFMIAETLLEILEYFPGRLN